MRRFSLFGILVILVAVVVACGSGDTKSPGDSDAPEVVQASLATSEPSEAPAEPAVVEIAVPLATAEPTRERLYRSYPAPTGYPGFRVYYQKRCYPGCHYSSSTSDQESVPTAQPTVSAERPYRSYPAPTGYPGFRKYYQKRCYPGCHYDSSAAEPTKVHP